MKIGRRGFIGTLVGAVTVMFLPKATAKADLKGEVGEAFGFDYMDEVVPTVSNGVTASGLMFARLADWPRFAKDGTRIEYYITCPIKEQASGLKGWRWGVRSNNFDKAAYGEQADLLWARFDTRAEADLAVMVLNSPLGEHRA